jgi:hypothetical protein
MLLRGYLKRIGLDSERPELFTSSAERRQIRVHDLRGTFVTLHLATGKSESWIADRTGHKSSQMINRYKRTARPTSPAAPPRRDALARQCPRTKRAPVQVARRTTVDEDTTANVAQLSAAAPTCAVSATAPYITPRAASRAIGSPARLTSASVPRLQSAHGLP